MSYIQNRFIVKGNTLTDSVHDSTLARSNFVRITTTSAQNTITVKDNDKNLLGSILLYTEGDTIVITKGVADRISTTGTAVISGTNLVPADQIVKNYCDDSENMSAWTIGSATVKSDSVSTTLSANITATQNYIPVDDIAGLNATANGTKKATIGTEDITFLQTTVNWMPYSEDFNQGWWTKRGLTTATGSQTDPNGGTTAYLIDNITRTGTYSDLYGYGANTGSGSANTAPSFYIKKVTQTGILYVGEPHNNTLYGNWEIDFSKLGDGWERITKEHIAVTETVNWITEPGGSTGFHMHPPGSTTQIWKFYLWGVQLELSADDSTNGYIPTTSARVKGLTTVTRGANNTTAATASSGATLTQKYLAPDGTLTADLVIPDAAAGYRSVREYWSGMVHTDNCIGSFYAKAVGDINKVFPNFAGQSAGNRWEFTLTGNGTVVSHYVAGNTAGTTWAEITKVGTDGWYRCSIGGVIATGNTTNRYLDIMPGGTDGVINGASDGTSGILVWGGQCEIVSGIGDRAGMYVTTGSEVPGVSNFEGEEITSTGI